MASEQYSAGIDIGGTKISVVITDSKGVIVGRMRKKSRPEKGFADVMSRVALCVEAATADVGITAAELRVAGVGAPSPILPTGIAIKAPNMGWVRVPLVKTLTTLLGCPVFAENDCNAGAFGEYVLGAGKGAKIVIGLFMGTGLGGGVIMDGKIFSGVNYMGTELGHITVQRGGRPCGCGKRGCLESYASKTGMGYHFKQAIYCDKRPSLLQEIAPKNLDNVSSSLLKQAWTAKDPLVVETLTEAAEYLGVGIANLITLFAPDAVVVGGGVFQELGRQLLPIVRQVAKEETYPPASFRHTRIQLAALGDDAVALGALEYAKMRVAQES